MEYGDAIPRPGLTSFLSTITERDSPWSTYGGSKRNLPYPPTAESVFKGLQQQEKNQENELTHQSLKSSSGVSVVSESQNNQTPNSVFSPTFESDSPYYPLGSEASMRPTTPRFPAEEVSSANYEPILIAESKGKALLNYILLLKTQMLLLEYY